MSAKINRRDFVVAGAAAGMSLAIPSKGVTQAPNVVTRSDFKPLVIS